MKYGQAKLVELFAKHNNNPTSDYLRNMKETFDRVLLDSECTVAVRNLIEVSISHHKAVENSSSFVGNKVFSI